MWVDYEYEETQTKLDVADLILEQMCVEVAEMLMAKNGQNKGEEDDDEIRIVKEFCEIEDEKEDYR